MESKLFEANNRKADDLWLRSLYKRILKLIIFFMDFESGTSLCEEVGDEDDEGREIVSRFIVNASYGLQHESHLVLSFIFY